MSHRKTSFGEMNEYNFAPLLGKFEIMSFERKGKRHTHDHVEIAVLLEGSGCVYVGDLPVEVDKNCTVVRIAPGVSHWMEPNGEGMKMLIVYEAKP